jgi:hypothetical protein
VYTWLDPQRNCYGFGYGSPWSLAVLILRPAEPLPLALSSSVDTSASDGALVIIVHNIRRGVVFVTKCFAMGVAKIRNRPV